MSQALYRKWRPQTFDDVIGQEHVIRTLRNALQTGHIHHAYLLAGPRGTGKTTTARLIAKAVNCLSPESQRPCDVCEMCRAVSDGRLMDLVEIDAASNTGVDNVRDLLEKVGYRPAQARFKVYVIDEVHMLSTAAFNALLKTLEEPPEHVIFVLATTEVHKIPETILSRCQRFEFRRIPLDAIVGQLKKIAEAEEIEGDSDAFVLIARAATGSMRDAISLFDQMSAGGSISADTVRLMLGAERREIVRSLLEAWLDEDLNRGLSIINTAVDNGADPRQLARQTTDFLRGLLLINLGAGHTWDDPTEEERPVFTELARTATVDNLVRAIENFSAAAEKRRTGWQPQLSLELAFIQSVQPAVQPAVQPSITQFDASSRPTQTVSKPADSKKGASRVAESRKPVKETEPGNVNSPKETASAQPLVSKKAHNTDSTTKDRMSATVSDADWELKIREDWQYIIQEMPSISLGALLRDASVVGADEQGKLVLCFQHNFHCERVNDPENRRELENVLSEHVGGQVAVRCLMNGEWRPPAQTSTETANASGKEHVDSPPSASESVENDSLIRRAQEELGAVAKLD